MPGTFRPLSAREFNEWLAFERVQGPWGDERADYHQAAVVQVLMNIHRDRKAHPQPFTTADAMLMFDTEDQDPDEMLQVAAEMTVAAGGRDTRPGKRDVEA